MNLRVILWTFTACGAFLIASPDGARADVIAHWNLNSTIDDTNVTTGTTAPAVGLGMASVIGGATAVFATGSFADPAGTNDNSGWNTRSYPSQNSGNKTRGVEFRVSTLGFESIVVSWAQRNSPSASRYLRFQWSSDATNFNDGAVISNAVADSFFLFTVDLNSVPAVNNNSNFAFRLVAEFESTATGAGTTQYIATASGSSYATSGTIRYDLVTISGAVLTGNAFPTISAMPNQTIPMNEITAQIPFSVGDVETPAESLIVSAASSNPALVPVENIIVEGSGANRFVTILPAFNQSGSATITLTVADGDGKTASTSFVVTVVPGNTSPTISGFTNYHTLINTPFAPIEFNVADAQTAAGDLIVTASSANPSLIPDANLVITGSGTRMLQVTPAPEQTGNAVITVTVSDGTLSASRSFSMMVLPSPSVLLCDSFSYPPGAIVSNSASLWSTYGGLAGRMQVVGGELRLTEDDTEDVLAQPIGSPFAPSNNITLYASFNVIFLEMPEASGAYFALFRELGFTYRARVFAATLRSEQGNFGLGIANASGNITNVAFAATTLTLNTRYLVVMRYDVTTGRSALWINPTHESDPHAEATDDPDPETIYSFAFRQNNGIGTILVDNVKIGLSFSDIIPGYRLRIGKALQGFELSWQAAATDEGYELQVSDSRNPRDWQTVPGVPSRTDFRDSMIVLPQPWPTFYRLQKP